MARHPSPDIDDELFNEIYGKAYTGPAQSKADIATQKEANKRVLSGSHSDEEDKPRDPNAVPTDFTSREAKVWEAKAKATERNWKKRKEEEMICKICGESGHFTQGCPSTLGASRKSAEFFERVPARDKNVRVLFSEKVILQIEMDVGCNIKMDEKFLFVSGKDRLILAKGVEAVHKIIQDGRDRQKSPSRSHRNESRSPHGSPKSTHLRPSESQRSHSSPRSTSHFPSRSFNQERPAEEHVRQDPHKMSRSSPRARGKFKLYVFDYEVIFSVLLGQTDLLSENSHKLLTCSSFPEAYPNDGGKDRQARSKSPLHPDFTRDTYRSYDGRNHFTGLHEDNWDLGRQRTDPLPEHKYEFRNYPQSLEELEKEFKEEVIELSRIQAQEEDEENYKHRECIRQLREDFMKKLTAMRAEHLKHWEEFLQRRLQTQQAVYSQLSLAEYDQSSRNLQYVGSSLPVDSASRYQYPSDNYSAPRPHEGYGEFQHQRHEDFGNTYGRY
ncbi:hypothetical protein ZIOFF_003347 [Zingiber officinale]|uniref:CCHC-type domain-containing protein n=1 Tax=Zingiber officinale TaxID=94328 RepID=A0A8J5IMX4_ZINOF|nr:hypothetical protein ZIOFF_003347 [Zingiber officinale]